MVIHYLLEDALTLCDIEGVVVLIIKSFFNHIN